MREGGREGGIGGLGGWDFYEGNKSKFLRRCPTVSLRMVSTFVCKVTTLTAVLN